VLLAELSLHGRFHEVDKVLFYYRYSTEQSINLSVKEKKAWVNPSEIKLMPPQVYSLFHYAVLPRKAPITVAQQLKCYFAVVLLCFKADKWRKLLIPGRYNYFGINFKR
jgi:hypothetical protein